MEGFDLGRVISRLFNMVIRTTLPVALPLLFTYSILGGLGYFLFSDFFGSFVELIGSGATDPAAIEALMTSLLTENLAKLLLLVVLMAVVGAFVRSGCLDSALRVGRGEEATMASFIAAGSANFGNMLVFAIIWGVASNLISYGLPFVFGAAGAPSFGQFLQVVVSVVAMGFFCCAAPAIVNEPGVNGLNAFGRSIDLTRGNILMIILTLVLIGLIMIIGMIISMLILGVIAGVLIAINPWLAVILILPTALLLSVIVQFTEGAMAALYQELKGVNEGGDADLTSVFS